jgi:hypothetical protein
MKTIYLFTITLLFSFSSLAQIQLGKNIIGDSSCSDGYYESISLSGNGKTVAIGVNEHSRYGDIRIYQFQSEKWVQLGKNIIGDSGFHIGEAVSLSEDGKIVAIEGQATGLSGTSTNLCKVFQYQSDSWIQLGEDIIGDTQISFNNRSNISISSDGSILALGSYGTLNDSGTTRIFKYQLDKWVQLGNVIGGEAAGDNSGGSVSLSSNGTVVAIGAPNNNGNGNESGHTRIYQYHLGDWIQMGKDIDGDTATLSGSAVSISSDGTTVAIGGNNDDNNSSSDHTRIYKYQLGDWIQLGKDIKGNKGSGAAVSISSNGNIIAIGTSEWNGPTRIYQFQSGSWVQIGADITGEEFHFRSGYSVSLSADGSILALSSRTEGDGRICTDDVISHTRIYEICELRSISSQPQSTTMPVGKTAQFIINSDYKFHQWQTDVGSGFQNVTNAGQYNGVDNDTLTVGELSIQNDLQSFRCLVQTEGCKDTSEVAILNVDGALSVDEIEVAFNVYPNPATDMLHIVNRSHSGSPSFTVLNPLGQEVLTGNISGREAAIDVSSLPKGYYLLNIGEGEYSYRFLVQ